MNDGQGSRCESQFKDEVGKVYGRLTVLERVTRQNGRSGKRTSRAAWLCRCACGAKLIVSGQNLRKGLVTACDYCNGLR